MPVLSGKRKCYPFFRIFSSLILLLILFVHCGYAVEPGDSGNEPGEVTVSPSPADDIPVTVVSYPEYKDPLIHINRAVFAFNHVTNRILIIPLSKAYLKVMPEPVYSAVDRFFSNIKSPVYFFNHLLQLKPRSMGIDLARFGINTTLGVFGLFDTAESAFKIKKEETSFNETLSSYGMGYGFYIVLPFIGPSDFRGSLSLVADYYLDPVTYLDEEWHPAYIRVYDRFHHNAPFAEDYEIIYKKSDDPYIFFRNLHLQGVQRDENY
jgi:phospholipid-binding lipoprotein MlaA